MKKVISALLAGAISLGLMMPAMAAEETSVKIYISTSGSDEETGLTLDNAVKTVEKAQELAKSYKTEGKKTEIIFDKGMYVLDNPIIIDADDSGEEGAPVIYRAYQGAEVTLTAADKISADRFAVSESSEIAPSAQGKVYEVALTDDEVAAMKDISKSASWYDMTLYLDTLYSDGKLLNISSYPNRNDNNAFNWSDNALDMTNGASDSTTGTYKMNLPTELQGKLTDKTDVMYECTTTGYAYSVTNVKSFTDTQAEFATVPANGFGNIYFMNTLYGIDKPGEYYIDMSNKMLYYYPVDTVADVYIATGADVDVITVENAEYVSFECIDVVCATGSDINIKNSNNITLYDCELSAANDFALKATDTTDLLVAKCTVTDTQRGGMSISGGDEKTLTGSNNIIRNCDIFETNKFYRTTGAGIVLNGVGTTVTNCEIHDQSYQAISFQGNDHIIENNRIWDVIKDVWDAGAIYSMRSWIGRGTEIKNNYIYDTRFDYNNTSSGYTGGTNNQAIYIDDLQSGITVQGNIIYNMSNAAMFGGGSDNTFTGNAIINCRSQFIYDAQGTGWRWQHINPYARYAGTTADGVAEFIASDEYDKSAYSEYANFDAMIARYENYQAEYAKLVANVSDDDKATLLAQAGVNVTDSKGNIDEAKQQAEYEILLAAYIDETQNGANEKLVKSVLGSVYNATVENNVMVGAWIDVANTGDYSTNHPFGIVAYKNNAEETVGDVILLKAVGSDSTATNIMYGEEDRSWVEISADKEITLDTDVSGISASTADMGITDDNYVPSFSATEDGYSEGNKYIAVMAIYNADGALSGVEVLDKTFMTEGQEETISVEVPEGAGTGWQIKLMFWDSMSGLTPVGTQQVVLDK